MSEGENRDTSPRLLLTVCIVTFRPDKQALLKTLETLKIALDHLAIHSNKVVLVDNSPDGADVEWITEAMKGLNFEIRAGHGNIGFGAANNMALGQIGQFHLVLNPDVQIAPDALTEALKFLNTHTDCGLVTPKAFNVDGTQQYLCKRFPNPFDLLLRGFAPAPIRNFFRARLDRYEMRDKTGDAVFWDPPITSGCFMLFRGNVFNQLKGFDPRYFLYFEDFDISLRTAKIARIAYVPTVKIIHGGGNAARKGLWHIYQFVRSGTIFFLGRA